jgi:hypothetical protein
VNHDGQDILQHIGPTPLVAAARGYGLVCVMPEKVSIDKPVALASLGAAYAPVVVPGGRVVLGELGRFSVWTVERRVRGWLGASTWRHAQFWSRSELAALAADKPESRP